MCGTEKHLVTWNWRNCMPKNSYEHSNEIKVSMKTSLETLSLQFIPLVRQALELISLLIFNLHTLCLLLIAKIFIYDMKGQDIVVCSVATAYYDILTLHIVYKYFCN
jgi:hypothetical protein